MGSVVTIVPADAWLTVMLEERWREDTSGGNMTPLVGLKMGPEGDGQLHRGPVPVDPGGPGSGLGWACGDSCWGIWVIHVAPGALLVLAVR
jgi:hypothetical protein